MMILQSKMMILQSKMNILLMKHHDFRQVTLTQKFFARFVSIEES